MYCWRGGKRSASLVHVLNEIGFPAVQLDGGYRTWRRHVVARLAEQPLAFRYRVVCGLTGSGKSRLLGALAAEVRQVLDLEALAKHRGSLLGDLPDDPQPSQKAFESAILVALDGIRHARTRVGRVGGRKIGALQVARRAARVDARTRLRQVALGLGAAWRCSRKEYAHFVADP